MSICSHFLLSGLQTFELQASGEEEMDRRKRREEEKWKPGAVCKGREQPVSIWDNPQVLKASPPWSQTSLPLSSSVDVFLVYSLFILHNKLHNDTFPLFLQNGSRFQQCLFQFHLCGHTVLLPQLTLWVSIHSTFYQHKTNVHLRVQWMQKKCVYFCKREQKKL